MTKRVESTESRLNFLAASSDSSNVFTDSESSCSYTFDYEIHKVDREVVERSDHKHRDGNVYLRVREYDALNLKDREYDGYLTDRIMEVSSCCLDRSARPGKFVLANCILSRKGLKNIELIKCHQYIKYLDLSRNLLTSVEALGHLPFLQYLDVSHNLITDLLNFKAPINLSYVNYSYNLIEDLVDLTDFWSLVYLDLSHNIIGKILGLGELNYLIHLDLSFNRIRYLCNINHLAIETLLLDNNSIEEVEEGVGVGLNTLLSISSLSVSNNRLTSLSLIDGLTSVTTVNAAHNKIADLVQIAHLRNLPYLYALDLQGNKVTKNPLYKQTCMNYGLRLRILDGELISTNEKGKASYNFSECPQKMARQTNIILDLLQQTRIPQIGTTTVPCYSKYVVFVILVGPIAANKRLLVSKLCAKYPTYARRCVSCTTRPNIRHEVDGLDYHFISDEEFSRRLLAGKFMCATQKYGYNYSIEYDELKKVAEDNGIMVLHCDMSCALQIRAKFKNCKLVLGLPRSRRTHRKWLRQKYDCTSWLPNAMNAYVVRSCYEQSQQTNENVPIGTKENARTQSVTSDQMDSFCERKLGSLSKRGSIPVSIMKLSSTAKVRMNVSFDAEQKAAAITPDSESYDLDGNMDAAFAGRDSQDTDAVRSSEVFYMHTKHSSQNPEHTASTLIGLNEASTFILSRISDSPMGSYVAEELHTMDLEMTSEPWTSSQTSSPSHVSSHVESSRSPSTDTERGEFGVGLEQSEMHERHSSKRSGYSGISLATQNAASQMLRTSDSEFILAQASNLQVANQGQTFLEYFIYYQSLRTKMYLDMYEANPGMFVTRVFTDEEDTAVESMGSILKGCVKMQAQMIAANASCKDTYVCKEMRSDKLKLIDDVTR